MDGRPSMEKAKAIREKRDLAKELEDVRAFERSAGQSSRPSRTKSNAGKQTTESESEDHNAIESEHSEDNSPNRRNAARRSIMAFLGDDTDD